MPSYKRQTTQQIQTYSQPGKKKRQKKRNSKLQLIIKDRLVKNRGIKNENKTEKQKKERINWEVHHARVKVNYDDVDAVADVLCNMNVYNVPRTLNASVYDRPRNNNNNNNINDYGQQTKRNR